MNLDARTANRMQWLRLGLNAKAADQLYWLERSFEAR